MRANGDAGGIKGTDPSGGDRVVGMELPCHNMRYEIT